MTCGVYKIGFRNTDKVYIGSSKDISKRIKQHKAMLENDCHHSYKLQAYYNNNKEFAYVTILQECDEYMRTHFEADFINEFNSIGNGFNVAAVRHAWTPDLNLLSEVIHLPSILPIDTTFLSKDYSAIIAVVAAYIKFNYNSCITNNIEYGEAYTSIADKLNISATAVKAAVRKLKESGVLLVTKKGKSHFNMNYYEYVNL